MLLVTFATGGSLYAVDARHVVEVVPRVDARPIPHAPGYVRGLLSYRGRVFPAVDFGALTGSTPTRPALNTRVIVSRFTRAGGERLIGLVAEDVSRVRDVDPGSAVVPAMSLGAAPYLGAVFRLDEGLVQLVEPDKLLGDDVARALYGDPGEPA